MPQLIIDLTVDQHARAMKVFGELLRLGRDATPIEAADALKTGVKDTVLAAENNRAISTAASSVASWE